MKGDVLDFSIQTGSGLISAEDGKRYSFAGAEWKGAKPPVFGMKVDFGIQGEKAVALVWSPLLELLVLSTERFHWNIRDFTAARTKKLLVVFAAVLHTNGA